VPNVSISVTKILGKLAASGTVGRSGLVTTLIKRVLTEGKDIENTLSKVPKGAGDIVATRVQVLKLVLSGLV
jgi:hypothetical protein